MKKIIKIAFAMVLALSFAFALTSCSKSKKTVVKKELAKVSESTIAYDGATLTWGAINNADQYVVSYNGNEIKVNEAKYDVVVEEDVTFGIKAIALDSNEYYKSCSEFVSKSFIYKGKIEPTFDAETKTYSWTAVDGTKGYKIKENGALYQGFQQETTYKMVSKLDADGNYSESFQVKAYFEEENTFTVWSDMQSYTVLANPQNVTYDGKLVKWDAVKYATGYTVQVYSVDADGKENVVKTTTVTANDFVFNAFGDNDGGEQEQSTVVKGSYSISIIANAESNSNILDSDEARFGFTYVDPIAELTMTEGVISWEDVTNADYYAIEINGQEIDEIAVKNSFTYTDKSSFTIRVMPRKYDGSLYSNWSGKYTFRTTLSPYINWISDGQSYRLDWSKDAEGNDYTLNNTSYQIVVKEYGTGNLGKTLTSTDTYYSGEELLAAIGSTKCVICTVQVKAITGSEGEEQSESYWSDPIYFYNLPDPDAYTISTTDIYTDNLLTTLYINDLQINNNFKNYNLEVLYRAGINSADAGDYNYSLDNDTVVNKSTVRNLLIPSNNSITGEKFEIEFKAESTDNKKMLTNEEGEKTVFIFSNEVITLECERLAAPTLNLEGTTITWNAVSMASGYQVKVEDNNGNQVGDVELTVGESFNLANLNLEGDKKYYVSVSALGNGNIIFSSMYSNKIDFTQLSIPANLRVVGNGDSRYIQWDAVNGCSSYELTIGTHKQTINDANQTTIDQSYLSSTGVGVTVTAIGNNASRTLTSNATTPIVLYKLKTPQNVKVGDSEISWDSVDAYGGKTVGYEVWIGSSRISGDDPLLTTSFSYYNYAEIRERYDAYDLDVQIKAVLVDQKETQFFSSELSEIANVIRLASPTSVKMNQYTGEITWEQGDINLSTITGYEVKIEYSNHEDLTETYVQVSTSFQPQFNEKCVGDTVTITVRALGNGVDYVSSNPYNVSTSGQDNMIGCVAKVVKLDPVKTEALGYTVDDLNHIQVTINESMLGDVEAYAYGIKIDGVLNTMPRINAANYKKDTTTGLYTCTLSNGSTATYNETTKVYTYTSRNSESGDYDIDVKYVGGNYSCDTSKVSDAINCFVDSDYTGVLKNVIILGQFVQSDISLNVSAYGSTISLLNKAHAVSYEYTVHFYSMGKEIGTAVSSTVAASTGANTTISLGTLPTGTTDVRISIRVLGNAKEYIFDSIKTFTTDLIVPNVDLTE